MAEKKPNQNSNKLSFKDFYTAEYRPGEDESINYRAYRRKRTDEGVGKAVDHTLAAAGEVGDSLIKGAARAAGYTMGIGKGVKKAYKKAKKKAANEAWDNKGRGPTGVAYAKDNPIHMKEIGKLIKHDKFKGNTSGLINHVKKKYPELHDHPAVQKAFQKHAETNESSEEWAKSQEKIRNKRRDAMLKPGDKEKINKIRDMMKKANEGTVEKVKAPVGQRPKGPGWSLHRSGEQRKEPHDIWKRTTKKVAVEESKYTLDDILTILGERYVAKSIANKRKASIRMKVGKTKHKAQIGRRKAMRRMATKDILFDRSRRQQWRDAFRKIAKGKRKKDMSIAQIRSIEKKLERPVWQRIVNRKSVIGVKDKRRLEIARKKGTWKK